jgi:hypothetical protein
MKRSMVDWFDATVTNPATGHVTGEIQDANPDLIQIYEFRGEDFNLIAG